MVHDSQREHERGNGHDQECDLLNDVRDRLVRAVEHESDDDSDQADCAHRREPRKALMGPGFKMSTLCATALNRLTNLSWSDRVQHDDARANAVRNREEPRRDVISGGHGASRRPYEAVVKPEHE